MAVVADAIRNDPIKWDEAILGCAYLPFYPDKVPILLTLISQTAPRRLHSDHTETDGLGRSNRALHPCPALQHRDRVNRRRDRAHRQVYAAPRNGLWQPGNRHLFGNPLRRDERHSDA